MSTLLPGSKEIFSMGYTMRRGVLKSENLPELSPHSGKSLRWRAPYSVPGCFRFLDQRRLDQRQRPSAAPSLLLQPSFERSGGEVSKDGETNPGISNHSPETPPLLPSTHHRNPNRISDEAGAT